MPEAIIVDAAPRVCPTWSRVIQCLYNYSSNIEKLKEKLKDLESAEITLKLQVNVAKRDAKDIGDNVLRWMEKVDKIEIDVNRFLEYATDTQSGCLYLDCPILFSRYNLSNQSLELTTKVNELLQDDATKFGIIGHPTPPGQMPFSSTKNFDGFESRMRTSNDVMEALRDNSITRIGICGMPGVGKTTLVNEIADKVKAAKLFDEVVMAVVSKDPVIGNIRDQLAENLGLKIEESTDRPRAERLYSRLMEKDENILLILDDLWNELDFHDIGIPEDARGGLKVLFTSRFRMVCDSMNATTFEVQLLSENEAWDLFKESARIYEEANCVKGIKQEVAKECGCLPLAIVAVGGALKNKHDYVWREVLQQLKEASVDNKVKSAIELSYNYLDNDSKLLLLLCSLFPQDFNIPVEVLVGYAKGLQWFISVKTMAKARDKVNLIKNGLKNSYLLLAGTNENYVKLHDVVRDVCLSVASSGELMHTVRHNGLTEWSQDDICVSSTAISLTFHQIDQLCCDFKYPELKLLRLTFKIDKLHIREDFFARMKEIKVLELCNLIGELPSSLQSLVNLRTLCFHGCKLYGDMSVIGSQTKLEILSFYYSYLEHFPDKISELSNLKSLDLRFPVGGPPLPSGILLKLRNLEELYFNSYFEEWESKGLESYSLQFNQFCAYGDHCMEQFLENLHYEKLIRFEINSTTNRIGMGEYQIGRNVLSLNRVNVDLLKKEATQHLLSRTEDLSLRKIDGLSNLVGELDGNGFVNVKKLNLESCDLKCLVDATGFRSSGGGGGGGGGVFINLEELTIEHAEKMEELCHWNLPVGSFARLREVILRELPALRHLWGAIQLPSLGYLRYLIMDDCDSIRSVFLKSSVKCLLQLEQMKIGYCQQLETIVSNGEDDDDTGNIEFPRLKDLILYSLESFTSFSPNLGRGILFSEKVMFPNLEGLEVNNVNGIRCIVDSQMPIGSLSKLKRIEISECDGLVHVVAFNSIKLLRSLIELDVEKAELVEVIFDFTCLNVEGAESLETPLARLEYLRLMELPSLKHIWRMLPQGINAFQNLREMVVKGCPKLRYLLSPAMATMLVSLETLKVHSCAQMEAIIGEGESEITDIEEEDGVEESTNKIVFSKLTTVQVTHNDNFRMLCSETVDLELPLLTELLIKNCPRMTKFCVGQLSAPRLSDVEATFSIKVALDEFSSWLKDCESRIRCLACSNLNMEMCDHLD